MLKNWNNLCYGKKSIFFIPDLLVWSFMSCRVLPRLNVNDIKKNYSHILSHLFDLM